MELKDFVKQYYEDYLEDYLTFEKFVNEENLEEYSKQINTMLNLIIRMIKNKYPLMAKRKKTNDLMKLLEDDFDDTVVASLHYFRIIRNNIAHNTENILKIDIATAEYLFYILNSFMAKFAKVHHKLDVEYENLQTKEPQFFEDHEEFYKKHVKSKIDEDIEELFTPEIKIDKIDAKYSQIIVTYLFEDIEMTELCSKYSMKDLSTLNEIMLLYGFNFEFVDYVSNNIQYRYFTKIINDFFKTNYKRNILLKVLELSESKNDVGCDDSE